MKGVFAFIGYHNYKTLLYVFIYNNYENSSAKIKVAGSNNEHSINGFGVIFMFKTC